MIKQIIVKYNNLAAHTVSCSVQNKMSSSRTNPQRKRRPIAVPRGGMGAASNSRSRTASGTKRMSAVEAARQQVLLFDEKNITTMLEGMNIPEEYRDKVTEFMEGKDPKEYIAELMQNPEKQESVLQQFKEKVSSYVDEETVRTFTDDCTQLVEWVKEKGVIHVYKVVKVIINILREYIRQRDATMFLVLKQVIPSMQTDFYQVYQTQIVDRGLADHDFVGLGWMGFEHLGVMLDQFQAEFSDDEAKITEVLGQLPEFVHMIISQMNDMGIELPDWCLTQINECLNALR